MLISTRYGLVGTPLTALGKAYYIIVSSLADAAIDNWVAINTFADSSESTALLCLDHVYGSLGFTAYLEFGTESVII